MTRKLLPFLLLLLVPIGAMAGNDFITNGPDHPVPVTVDGVEIGDVVVSQAGAAHVAASHVSASTTAGTVAIARATRRTCLIRNTDAAISVYIGPATVTAGNGQLLKAGESVVVSAVTLWQVIAASGTPVIAITDEYD